MVSRGKTALLLGSTGETGKELLRELERAQQLACCRLAGQGGSTGRPTAGFASPMPVCLAVPRVLGLVWVRLLCRHRGCRGVVEERESAGAG